MILRRLNLYSFRLSDSIPRITPKEDVDLVFLDAPKPGLMATSSEKLIDSRFARGEFCCCALDRSEVISYCWMAFDWESVGEINRVVRLRHEEVYLFDAFTYPHHRGKDLFPAVLSKSLEWAKSHGYSRALIFALSDNQASTRAIAKAGFKLVQAVIFLRLFSRTLCWLGRKTDGEEPVRFRRPLNVGESG